MTPSSTTRDDYRGTRSVLRAVRILKVFSDERPALTLSEVARAAGLHKTTALRILADLEHEAMVVRDAATGAYRLGPAAVALGARAVRSTDLRTIARPELERLAERSGETVTLEVLAGEVVLVLDEIMTRHVVGVLPDVGKRWPAHATSTGKALLAASLRRGDAASPTKLMRFTSRTITAPDRLRQDLERTLRRGYAVAAEELEAGFVAVGAAILGPDGRVLGAFSVGGPRARMTRERIPQVGALVREAAERVSRLLGA